MKYETVIKGGKVVIPKVGVQDTDICIANGKVAALVARGSQIESNSVIDATGKHIFPGAIDPHVHWGYSGTVAMEAPGESRAAVIGGTTTAINFTTGYDFHDKTEIIKDQDTPPKPDDDLGFAAYKASHEKACYTDFTFTFRVSDEARIERIHRAAKDWGVTSFKFYMVYNSFHRDDIYSHYTDSQLLESMQAIQKTPKGVACVHCENSQMTAHYLQKTEQAGEHGLQAWDKARPDFSEAEAMNRALFLAETSGCPTYIVHITNRRALDVFSKYRQKGLRVYVETLPNFLLQTIDSPVGVLGKTNPPLRKQADCDALWEAVKDGRIDTIASDCCAKRKADKLGSKGNIWTTTAAYPGSATNLPLMISEGYHKRGISLMRIAELTSYNAASIFSMYPQKGTIMPGSDADLAIIDLNLEKTVTPEMLQGYCDYSIWDGWKVKGWPVMTLLRGKTIVKDGNLTEKQNHGQYVWRS